MKVLYGKGSVYADVTTCAVMGSKLYVPRGDGPRASLYGGDPCPGILKEVIIEDDFGGQRVVSSTEQMMFVRSDSGFNLADATSQPHDFTADMLSTLTPEAKLALIHSRLVVKHGHMHDEYPEQLMAATFIRPDDVVLEIGANIGRNTLVISSLLRDSSNLVTVESDPSIAAQLRENLQTNGSCAAIVNAAISRQKMAQQGWRTRVTDTIPAGWKEVPTISWAALKTQHPLSFTTLVADCEGAMYYILQEEPTFLDGFRTVIIENDFTKIEHKKYFDECMRAAGFAPVYNRALKTGWSACDDCFFQTWQKLDA